MVLLQLLLNPNIFTLLREYIRLPFTNFLLWVVRTPFQSPLPFSRSRKLNSALLPNALEIVQYSRIAQRWSQVRSQNGIGILATEKPTQSGILYTSILLREFIRFC